MAAADTYDHVPTAIAKAEAKILADQDGEAVAGYGQARRSRFRNPRSPRGWERCTVARVKPHQRAPLAFLRSVRRRAKPSDAVLIKL